MHWFLRTFYMQLTGGLLPGTQISLIAAAGTIYDKVVGAVVDGHSRAGTGQQVGAPV